MSHQAQEPVEDTVRRPLVSESEQVHEPMDTGQVPGTPAMSSQFTERPSDAQVEEIEAERRRRLEHRPPFAEVDNTHRTFDPELGRFEDCDSPMHKH